MLNYWELLSHLVRCLSFCSVSCFKRAWSCRISLQLYAKSIQKTRLVLLSASSGVNFCTNGPNSPSCSPSSLGLRGFLEICNLWGVLDPQNPKPLTRQLPWNPHSSPWQLRLQIPGWQVKKTCLNLFGKQRKWCHPRDLLDMGSHIYNQTFQWWNVMNVLRSGERSNWHSKGR